MFYLLYATSNRLKSISTEHTWISAHSETAALWKETWQLSEDDKLLSTKCEITRQGSKEHLQWKCIYIEIKILIALHYVECMNNKVSLCSIHFKTIYFSIIYGCLLEPFSHSVTQEQTSTTFYWGFMWQINTK